MTSTRRSPFAAMAFALFALLLIAPSAGAAWGDIDTTFAPPTGTTQYLPAGASYGVQTKVMIQPDGKILVAGSGGPSFFTHTPMFQRFLPDGTPDPSFGTGGTLLVSTAAISGKALTSAVLQPDGKIVAVATSATSGDLFRVTASGALDTSFASPDGYVALSGDLPQDVLVHSSGDIYVGSQSATNGFPVLRRFTSVGTQIGTFQTTSTSNLSSVTFDDYSVVLLREVGSGIVLITDSEVSSTPRFFAAKMDSTGSLDSSWGTSGKTTVAFSIASQVADAVVQPSGALVIGGATETMGDSVWALTRLTPGGTIDPSFAGGGKVELNYSTSGDSIGGIASTPDGGLLAAGYISDPAANNSRGGIRLMTADGLPQTGFGPDGLRIQTLPGEFGFNDAAMQADGKAIGVGSVYVSAAATVSPVTTRFQNNYVAPLVPLLKTKVGSPKGSKISAKKLTKFSGTASTSAGTVSKVELAVQQVDKSLLKKSKRCLWLSTSKVKFKKVKAIKSKCASPKWLKASGTAKWNYKLKKGKKLPKGSYVLSVRATASDGTVQAKPTVKKFKVV